MNLSKWKRGPNWREIDFILSCISLSFGDCWGGGVESMQTGSTLAILLVLPSRGKVADCTTGISSTTGKISPMRPSLLVASADGTRLGLAGTGDRSEGSLGWRLSITSNMIDDRGSELVEYFLTGWSAIPIRPDTRFDWYKWPPAYVCPGWSWAGLISVDEDPPPPPYRLE